ncbi:cupredoxin domain-containing protein [Candidatus Pacearchaeota archaeon]|nr:cupredoxin domain-containing protein [Candidatus Pacearchaeota archaeon]
MKIKKTTLYLVLIIILVTMMGFFLLGNENIKQDNVTPNTIDGEFQKVVLSMKNLNYYPNTIKVKANQPVEITLDDSVRGCLRSFYVKDFGVNKYSRTSNDKITFTPNKKGTFRFACSMGMGTGTLVVE